jgi:hypothetical protein
MRGGSGRSTRRGDIPRGSKPPPFPVITYCSGRQASKETRKGRRYGLRYFLMEALRIFAIFS